MAFQARYQRAANHSSGPLPAVTFTHSSPSSSHAVPPGTNQAAKYVTVIANLRS